MITKKYGKICKKDDEQKQVSVVMSRGLFMRLEKMSELEHRKRSEQVRFLLEGVLPPLEELEAAAKKFSPGCTSTYK